MCFSWFFFLLLLSSTSVAASISHFLTSVKKKKKIRYTLFLSLDLPLALLATSVKTLTFSRI